MDAKEVIARRVAQEFKDGYVVNLGIGIPTMSVDYIPDGVNVILQSENGFVGLGGTPEPGKVNKDIVNAGSAPVSIVPGAAFFDSAMSFGLIRGGHVDATVLGSLEVDQEGNIANYMVPGKMIPGMGGAMDLVTGAKAVIVAMTHDQKGAPKILKKCTLPLTGAKKVTTIITELCVMVVTDDGLVLTETAPGVTLDQIKAATDADYTVSPDCKEMAL